MSESRSVLVVEDREASADLTGVLLASEGWRVDTARDGAAALARLSESFPDVVLCDLLMPGMDGLSLLRAMAGVEALRELPVVVFTAAGDDLVGRARAAHPGVTVLRKPAEPAEILAALAEAAGGKGEGR